jgi:predicted DNA binding CopG/RHH family protein
MGDKYTDAQKKASIKYLEKLDEIRIRMPKGEKNNIKEAASAAGESMNQYIINAVDQRMERDKRESGE